MDVVILAVSLPNGQTAVWSGDEGLPVRARRGLTSVRHVG